MTTYVLNLKTGEILKSLSVNVMNELICTPCMSVNVINEITSTSCMVVNVMREPLVYQ